MPTVTDGELLKVVNDLTDPLVERGPTTASEVAERVDITRQHALRRLRALTDDAGPLRTKKVAPRARVFWVHGRAQRLLHADWPPEEVVEDAKGSSKNVL